MATKRKRKKPDDEPLFVEDDEERATDEAPEPRVCLAPGCQITTLGSKYCLAHEIILGSREKYERRARRGGGDFWSAVTAGGLGVLSQLVSNVSTEVEGAVANLLRGQVHAGAPAAAPPMAVDPFAVLGLDPTTATPEKVRDMQRQLAKIYHTDKGTDGAAEQKLKEVNAAAAECLKRLRGAA